MMYEIHRRWVCNIQINIQIIHANIKQEWVVDQRNGIVINVYDRFFGMNYFANWDWDATDMFLIEL